MTSLLKMVSQLIFQCLLVTNSFIGRMNSGKFPYKDASGYDLDSQTLVFKVKF